ncbi:unnamed protein product [Dovyalis caffra]|uniref:Uncharacterized protein n=1 Tax=Dovyalis caffra TaxID=77055 RepID=A0AAV1QU53_9ROSI|nr:unnamed protein product [Dovyalis caffra]
MRHGYTWFCDKDRDISAFNSVYIVQNLPRHSTGPISTHQLMGLPGPPNTSATAVFEDSKESPSLQPSRHPQIFYHNYSHNKNHTFG